MYPVIQAEPQCVCVCVCVFVSVPKKLNQLQARGRRLQPTPSLCLVLPLHSEVYRVVSRARCWQIGDYTWRSGGEGAGSLIACNFCCPWIHFFFFFFSVSWNISCLADIISPSRGWRRENDVGGQKVFLTFFNSQGSQMRSLIIKYNFKSSY